MSPDLDLSVLAGGLDHPEGVAWDAARQRLVFGTEGGVLQALDPRTGVVETLASGGGFLLGVAVPADGSVFACDMTNSCVWRWQAGSSVLEPFFRHPSLRVPNYAVLRPEGGLWVSDSGSCWDGADGTIWFVDDRGGALPATEEELSFPNGMALANDGRTLYCLESHPARLLAFPVRADGTLGVAVVAATFPGSVPDGLVVLPDDSVIIACYRPDQLLAWRPGDAAATTLVADPHGRRLAGPANLCLFGPELGRLAVSNVGGNHLTEVHGAVPDSRRNL